MNKKVQRAVAAGIVIPFVVLTSSGCATTAKNVSAQYVSPLQYQSYNCEQIGLEVQRIASRVGELTGQVDDRATKDAWAMGVGLVLFWPALFFLSGGNSAKEAELARMKGEYDALQQVAIQRNCTRVPATTTATAPPAESAPAPSQGTVAATPLPIPESATPPAATAAVAPAPLPTPAVAPPVAVKVSLPAGGTSKYMINAERHAKANGCATPASTMTIAAPGYEVFTIACASSETLLVRCDYGNCRTLQ